MGVGARRGRLFGVMAGALVAVSGCSGIGSPAPTVVKPAAATVHVSLAGPNASPRASGPGGSVTMTAVGDTMLGNTPDLPPDPASYLSAVEPILAPGSQIVFGNLEGTLTTSTASKCPPVKKTKKKQKASSQECFAFRIPPSYARYLKQDGFTILNDANNHSLDFGAAGQGQTVESIHAAGLAQTGLPGEITLVVAHGVKVAFVAFAPYDYDANLLDLPAAQALIERAGREADFTVVYMHAGAEGATADHVTGREEYYLGEDRGNAEKFAHMAIDAGASLVIASGPHVIRGMQFYQGHLIAYSVGNFAGYGDFATGGVLDLSVVLHVTLSSDGRFEQARIYPIQFTGPGQPVPGGGAVPLVAQLSREDFGSSAARISASGIITAP